MSSRSTAAITVKDRGYKKLLQAVNARPQISVGVHNPEAAAAYDDGITIGAVAEIHEFGLGSNPERSWLRAYVDGNGARIQAFIRRAAEAVVAGKITPDRALVLVGLQMVGEIKQRIQAGIKPELSKAYAKRKGANKTTPLIRFGQFIGSITSKLVQK